MFVGVMAILYLHRLVFRRRFNPLIAFWGSFVLIVAILAATFLINLNLQVRYVPMFVLTGMQLCLTMKIISFAQMQLDIRRIIDAINDGTFEIRFNENDVDEKNFTIINKHKDDFSAYLTVKRFLYFMVLPTYCYQLDFPKIKSIRAIWTLKNIGKFVLGSVLCLFILLEFTYPALIQVNKALESDASFFIIYPLVS